jgi:toxin-antitoxin system PIN domain toxin
VILIDANLLIYATTKCPQRERSRDWLDGQLNGSVRVGLPWASLIAFLRITTNRRLYSQPWPVEAAWKQIEEWLACPNVWIPVATDRHQPILARTLQAAGEGGNLIADAHLAALAIEHGLTLCSTDRDFGRFSGLKWVNPLATGG